MPPHGRKDAERLSLSAHDYAAKHFGETLTYIPGRMVVHDGLTLHAIGRAAVSAPKGLRITLQGHAVRVRQGWMLYW